MQEDQQRETIDQEIHLRDYYHVIKKRKQVVGLFAAITFCLVFLVTFAVTPLYEADTQVLIEKNKETDLTVAGGMLNYDPEFLQTQFEIIKSNNVVYRVIDQLKLDTKYRGYFLKDEKEGLLTASLDSVKAFFSSSTDSNEAVALQGKEQTDADRIAEIIQEELNTKPLRNTKIVSVTYRNPNPIMSSMVVNALVDSYMAELLEIKMHASNYSLQWMTTKAEEERKKLQKSEMTLQKYRQENNIVTVENKQVVVPGKLAEFSIQLSKAQALRKEHENLYNQIQGLASSPSTIESLPLFANNLALQRIRDQMLVADQKITELSSKYGSKHPLMIKALADLDILSQEKAREIKRIVETSKNQYILARSQEHNIEKLLDETKQEMLNLNEKMIQYDIMQRESETNRVLYDSLMKNIKQQGATEQSQMLNVWVVKKAQIPENPATPNKKRNILLGLVLGLFGGIGCAFFIEYLDNTVKSSEEVERRFKVPVLGVVGQVDDKNKSIETIIIEDPRSPTAECYKSIRSSLMLSSPEHPPKTLLITSVEPQEGKTSTSLNIARTLAQTGSKVLLLDCDMRKPRLHTILRISNRVGLSSFLSGNTDKEIVAKLEENNLTVIPSGPIPPNPSELLGSERMANLLQGLAKKFDYIILDTPPIMSVTDSQVLSHLVAGVVMVTRAGKTNYEMLGKGLKMLQSIHAPLLGIVINGMSEKISGDYYYGGYYKQYYTAAEPETQEKSAA
ncbi:MAG: polysaccharide biosynthesis tyrosine autokinase [Proteobacteria bacterium]|nr:polysaccharide biosynthesis tyrosine autokinase [Pseudomonadota bacterium]